MQTDTETTTSPIEHAALAMALSPVPCLSTEDGRAPAQPSESPRRRACREDLDGVPFDQWPDDEIERRVDELRDATHGSAVVWREALCAELGRRRAAPTSPTTTSPTSSRRRRAGAATSPPAATTAIATSRAPSTRSARATRSSSSTGLSSPRTSRARIDPCPARRRDRRTLSTAARTRRPATRARNRPSRRALGDMLEALDTDRRLRDDLDALARFLRTGDLDALASYTTGGAA